MPKLLHDQSLESTMEQSKETSELADFALALNHIQKAPLPLSLNATTPRSQSDREVRKFHVQTANSILTDDKPIFEQVEISSPRPFHILPQQTPTPVRATTRRFKITKGTTPLTTTAITPKPSRAQIFDRLPAGVQSYTYKPITDYDYYDDGNPRISIPEHSKVLIHSSGVIECLDQGNFPHPVSCKKFISCAKMETGDVLGWEYTCPKNLSFDPIGGICNWSAGLGCNE